MPTLQKPSRSILLTTSLVAAVVLCCSPATYATTGGEQDRAAASSLTPLQFEIEQQRLRLNSSDAEDRRDALVRLAAMHNPDASRAALAGLKDPVAIVKVTAAVAILSLPAEESTRDLIPLLADSDEFVRRETVYALGRAGSRSAVAPIVEVLLNDKFDSVRGAAAVALGELGDETAVSPLSSILSPDGLVQPKQKKKKTLENPFVLRAAARSLGQIGSRAGLPALIRALQNEQSEADVRRESAVALGAVGDPSALPALREALTASDPYLSQVAQESITRIQKTASQ
jgi:HEAT repeat protein